MNNCIKFAPLPNRKMETSTILIFRNFDKIPFLIRSQNCWCLDCLWSCCQCFRFLCCYCCSFLFAPYRGLSYSLLLSHRSVLCLTRGNLFIYLFSSSVFLYRALCTAPDSWCLQKNETSISSSRGYSVSPSSHVLPAVYRWGQLAGLSMHEDFRWVDNAARNKRPGFMKSEREIQLAIKNSSRR